RGVRHDGVAVQVADNSTHLDVIRPADHQDEVALPFQILGGLVDATDERTSCVDQLLARVNQVLPLPLADTVGGDDDAVRQWQAVAAVLRVHGEAAVVESPQHFLVVHQLAMDGDVGRVGDLFHRGQGVADAEAHAHRRGPDYSH